MGYHILEMALGAVYFIIYSTYRQIELKDINFEFQRHFFFLVSWSPQIGFEQRRSKFSLMLLFLLMSLYVFKTSFLGGNRCNIIYFDNRLG